jgi:hypothetical protein
MPELNVGHMNWGNMKMSLHMKMAYDSSKIFAVE